MWDTAGEVGINSKVTFSYEPLSNGHASVGWPTRTYLQQFCMDTGCSLEDPVVVIDDWDE